MPATSPDHDDSLQSVRASVAASDGWAEVVEALNRREAGSIDGAWGSSAAAAAAALADGRTAPILIVVPHLTDVGQVPVILRTRVVIEDGALVENWVTSATPQSRDD